MRHRRKSYGRKKRSFFRNRGYQHKHGMGINDAALPFGYN